MSVQLLASKNASLVLLSPIMFNNATRNIESLDNFISLGTCNTATTSYFELESEVFSNEQTLTFIGLYPPAILESSAALARPRWPHGWDVYKFWSIQHSNRLWKQGKKRTCPTFKSLGGEKSGLASILLSICNALKTQ